MVRKNSAPQAIGKGKAGTGKRSLYKEGAGKKHLKVWRATSKPMRQHVLERQKAGTTTVKAYTKAVLARRKS